MSASGQQYTQLPNAFSYRKAFNPSCSCKGASQTWADALKALDDQTIERGDIVVTTEEQARRLSQPQTDAQGKPIRPPPSRTQPTPKTAATPDPETPPEETDPSKRKVRSVGPAFYPVR